MKHINTRNVESLECAHRGITLATVPATDALVTQCIKSLQHLREPLVIVMAALSAGGGWVSRMHCPFSIASVVLAKTKLIVIQFSFRFRAIRLM
jgi:hypothetical protein